MNRLAQPRDHVLSWMSIYYSTIACASIAFIAYFTLFGIG
jgi:hypothetical protein